LQSAERGRNMLSAHCPAALNQHQTVAIGQTREKSRIEFPIVPYDEKWKSIVLSDLISERDKNRNMT
jgi:hypothetical protein